MFVSNRNQFIIQYLTLLMISCMKILRPDGNKEHMLLSSMMVYTFIGVLFSCSSIHFNFIGWVWEVPVAYLYQVHAGDTTGHFININFYFPSH